MRKVLVEQAWIWGVCVAISAVVWSFGLDAAIAKAIYNPQSGWAWAVRQYSVWLGIGLSVLALLFLLAWWWRVKFPVVKRMAVVWLVALIIGGGLINQVMVKELVQRPRPRESVLIEEQLDTVQMASLTGKSFPSGHAVVGFIFVAPFFALRRRKSRAGAVFVAAGLAGGAVVGGARMVLGAHYLTDVLWAGAILFATASVVAAIFTERRDISNKFTVPFLVLVAFCIVWFNKFSLDLTMDLSSRENMAGLVFDLPCEVDLQGSELLQVKLKGYGAPLSFLQLEADGKEVYLQRWRGIYRDLKCEAKVIDYR